jgi:hypothetical protein
MRNATRKTASVLLALVIGLSAAPTAFADDHGARGRHHGRPLGARGGPCGAAALTGEAPAIMTYDKSTGTQVFVSGKAQTEVSAYNRETGSSAALKGDLGRPGVVSSCSSDGVTHDSYAVTSEGPGQLAVVGHDGASGQTWGAVRGPDGRAEWLRNENNCFKAGLGLFVPGGAFGPAVGGGPGVGEVGLATGDKFVGLGVDTRGGLPSVGLVGC